VQRDERIQPAGIHHFHGGQIQHNYARVIFRDDCIFERGNFLPAHQTAGAPHNRYIFASFNIDR